LSDLHTRRVRRFGHQRAGRHMHRMQRRMRAERRIIEMKSNEVLGHNE
jgi:hypothetical protein